MSRKLLIISNGYPNKEGNYLGHIFVKSFVREAKEHFSKIVVLALIPFVPTFFKKYTDKHDYNFKDYNYENVEIRYKRFFYLPVFPFRRFKPLFAYFVGLVNKRFLSFSEFDHIHAHFSNPSGYIAYRLSKKYNISYTLTIHENHEWLKDELKANNPYLIKTWENAKTIIRVNPLDIELIKKYNANVSYIPNGYDHRIFKPMDKKESRKRIGYSENPKIIINVSFCRPVKRQELLIKAIEELCSKGYKEIKCIIIGEGPLRQKLLAQVKSNKLQDNVAVIGQIPQHELPHYLNSADLFCLPSDSEGNPTVMFESLGCGLPFISTRVGGVPSIITSTDLGLLSDIGDYKSLVKNLETALTGDWDRWFIAEYAHKFTWKNIVAETIKKY